MNASVPRGIRNNNPGNIEKGTKWKGLADIQPDPRFCTFISAEFGIRAMFRILNTYQTKYKKKSIRDMISRWAPPSENDTEAYIKAVSKACGNFPPDKDFPLDNIELSMLLVAAIIKHENGQQPYLPSRIRTGITMK